MQTARSSRVSGAPSLAQRHKWLLSCQRALCFKHGTRMLSCEASALLLWVWVVKCKRYPPHKLCFSVLTPALCPACADRAQVRA